MMNHIWAILWKELKDTLKNKEILIQFLMFPVMTIIMENAVHIEGMPEHFFTNLFASMYMGMAPLTSVAAIIAEEKEKNTLRVLQISNVKAMEYLASNAIYVVSMCMIGTLVMGVAGGYRGKALIAFLLIMFVGHSISTLVGATIGAVSKTQMAATSLSVPVMMVFSFLPMLGMFNETIQKAAELFFSQQLFALLNQLTTQAAWAPANGQASGVLNIETSAMVIMAVNMIVAAVAFVLVYKKSFTK